MLTLPQYGEEVLVTIKYNRRNRQGERQIDRLSQPHGKITGAAGAALPPAGSSGILCGRSQWGHTLIAMD